MFVHSIVQIGTLTIGCKKPLIRRVQLPSFLLCKDSWYRYLVGPKELSWCICSVVGVLCRRFVFPVLFFQRLNVVFSLGTIRSLGLERDR